MKTTERHVAPSASGNRRLRTRWGLRGPLAAVAMLCLAGQAHALTFTLWLNPSNGKGGEAVAIETTGSGLILQANATTPVASTSLAVASQTWLLSASPAAGYQFVQWDATGGASIPPAAITDPNAAVVFTDHGSVQARFELIPPEKLTLVVLSDGNHSAMNPSPFSTNSYNEGAYVPLTATPATDYRFLKWGDPDGGGALHPLVVNATNNSTTIHMTFDTKVQGYFLRQYKITQLNPQGTGSPSTIRTVDSGSFPTVEVPSTTSTYGLPDGQRAKCIGWSGGFGDIPITGADTYYTYLNPVSTDSGLSWNWAKQYRLRVARTAGGIVTPYDGNDDGSYAEYWFDEGSSVRLRAVADTTDPAQQYRFLQWTGDVPAGDEDQTSIDLVMNQARSCIAEFAVYLPDYDGDGLPNDWEEQFGLDMFDPTGDNGRNGDPDRDGLSNYAEFFGAYSNEQNGVTAFLSPIDADTDGDEMDDNWELRVLNDPAQDPTVVPAWYDDDTGSQYGKNGNPDGDVEWSTSSGYRQASRPLNNWLEWTGPDGIVPYTYVVIPEGTPGNNVAADIRMRLVNLADTGDRSNPRKVDTDLDGFDDGFEYAWDIWHRESTSGTNVTYIANTNIWPGITSTVPVWASSGPERRFNPAVVHPDPNGLSSYPDYDTWFNVDTGQKALDNPLADIDEYQASVTTNRTIVYPVVRVGGPGNNAPWCTNPFLWDTDGDGLPDGWELVFGFDPWDVNSDDLGPDDGDENPDHDFYAVAGDQKHVDVYLAQAYHPGTGWNYWPPRRGHPDTDQYTNLEELRGLSYAATMVLGQQWQSTHPRKLDTDGDGIWDGWEYYIGANALDPTDAAIDGELDGLTLFEEFDSFGTSTNVYAARVALPEWLNKLLPTDPNDPDTDWDQVGDGAERTFFNAVTISNVVNQTTNGVTGVVDYQWTGGGGLNPTTVDTDGDSLPDAWESYFEASMDGTTADELEDPDGDRLLNYQEYMVGCVYHWQYLYNSGGVAWEAGRGLYGYEPYDFFDPDQSMGGQWYIGPGGRAPYFWDPHAIVGPPWHPVPYRFMTASVHPSGIWFSTTDPGSADTDLDNMDDYWEVFHGVSPVYGTLDWVLCKVFGGFVTASWVDQWLIPIDGVPDVTEYPWIAGDALLDVDQDQSKSIDESLQWWPFEPLIQPPYYHTDPSPMWMTDISSPESWVNQYYWLGEVFGSLFEWYWDFNVLALFDFAPTYMFDFEMNEGMDTDNDNIADTAELGYDSQVSPGVTDPLDSISPIRRRALYLNGDAAARTGLAYAQDTEQLRTFTVECWVRAEEPATGARQTILERVGYIPQGNTEAATGEVLANFRIGLDGDGRPFGGYNGNEDDYLYVETLAGVERALTPNVWYHLALSYGGAFLQNGQWQGNLKLYINGVLVASTPSSVIPSNGWIGGASPGDIGGVLIQMPIVAGASDDWPDGWVDGAPILVGPMINVVKAQPMLKDFFRGWVDQIRIWDGTRSQDKIESLYLSRMTRSEVNFYAQNEQMLYAYSFDDLPDPDHSPIVPYGFDLVDARPADYDSVPFWALANDRSQWYSDYRYLPHIENLVAHVALDPPRDSAIPQMSATNWYPNSSNPYGMIYRHASRFGLEQHPLLPSGGGALTSQAVFEDLARYPDMLPLRWAVADEDIAMWDGGGVPSDQPYDTDGDGLPDEWEVNYGLDPNDPTGANGAFGDPDADRLTNLAEYQAGTNPYVQDSDFNGISDYDDRADPTAQTWGELLTDNDNMADTWERQYDPSYISPLVYDAHLDRDEDGWRNLEESWNNTDPSLTYSYPVPPIEIKIEYSGLRFANLVLHAYSDALMDGPPDAVYTATVGELGNAAGEVLGLSGFPTAGTLNNGNLLPGSLQIVFGADSLFDTGTGVLVSTDPTASGLINYVTGAYQLFFTGPGEGYPLVASYSFYDIGAETFPFHVVVQEPEEGRIREGHNWFFGFFDMNDDGLWNYGEPAGLAQGQPIEIGSSLNRIEIGLTDELIGYPRFDWVNAGTEFEEDTFISIRRSSDQTLVYQRTFLAGRNFIHEGDLRAAGMLGLPVQSAGTTSARYDVYVDGVLRQDPGNPEDPAEASFTNKWVALTAPQPVEPLGAYQYYNQVALTWKMQKETTSFQIEVRRFDPAGEVVVSQTVVAPYRRRNAGEFLYSWTLPQYIGDFFKLPGGGVRSFSNGVYYWRIKAKSPSFESPWSVNGSFRADVVADREETGTIRGEAKYFGRVTPNPVVVQAFASASFNDRADGQVTLSNSGTFTLAGLQQGLYYLRAFIDQNDNGDLDDWETWGYVHGNDPTNSYEVVSITATDRDRPYVTLVMHDADTDRDGLPDGWEYQNFYVGGSDWLAIAGPGTVYSSPPYTDHDGDGVNDWKEAVLGTNPWLADTDGDGVDDRTEVLLGSYPADPATVTRLIISDLLALGSGEAMLSWRVVTDGPGGIVAPLSTAASAIGEVPIRYTVEVTESLTDPLWQTVTSLVSTAVGGEDLSATDAEPGVGSKFYQLKMNVE